MIMQDGGRITTDNVSYAAHFRVAFLYFLVSTGNSCARILGHS